MSNPATELTSYFGKSMTTLLHNDNENSIWFWTKYIEFRDYDGDALADPIIAYGTSGINHTDDGRIIFIIYSKGRKIAIRHQNSDLDFGRETQVDRSFYDMPQSLQKTIKEKIRANGEK